MQLFALEKRRPFSSAEPAYGALWKPAQEVRRSHALFAFELHFDQLDPGFAGACGKHSVIVHVNLPRLRAGRCGDLYRIGKGHAVRNEFFAIESCECTGPRLKSTPSVVKFMRGTTGKIHAAIFAIEHGREAYRIFALRL